MWLIHAISFSYRKSPIKVTHALISKLSHVITFFNFFNMATAYCDGICNFSIPCALCIFSIVATSIVGSPTPELKSRKMSVGLCTSRFVNICIVLLVVSSCVSELNGAVLFKSSGAIIDFSYTFSITNSKYSKVIRVEFVLRTALVIMLKAQTNYSKSIFFVQHFSYSIKSSNIFMSWWIFSQFLTTVIPYMFANYPLGNPSE